MNNNSSTRQHEAAMGRFIERMGGLEEWVVKGFFNQTRAEAQWLARRRSQGPGRPGSPPGLARLQKQSLRLQAREALDHRLAETCGNLLDDLNLLASQIVTRRIQAHDRPEAAREMVLHWALLLPAAAAAAFRRRIEYANAEQNHGGLALEVSGPRPPYTFCPALEAEPATLAMNLRR